MSRIRRVSRAVAVFSLSAAPALAGLNIAVIDNGRWSPQTEGVYWCQFFVDHGHTCTLFPKEGPTGPLDGFDTVVDMSWVWADPMGSLADFLRLGKTVVLHDGAPFALGIDSDPLVQEWIGAGGSTTGFGGVFTVAEDPILGDIPIGTGVGLCDICLALVDPVNTSGAKVLARFGGAFADQIGIMRNIWEGGVSVYLLELDATFELHQPIILNAVNARVLTIPTLGEIGLIALGVAIAGGGIVIISRRHRVLPSPPGEAGHTMFHILSLDVICHGSRQRRSAPVFLHVPAGRLRCSVCPRSSVAREAERSTRSWRFPAPRVSPIEP